MLPTITTTSGYHTNCFQIGLSLIVLISRGRGISGPYLASLKWRAALCVTDCLALPPLAALYRAAWENYALQKDPKLAAAQKAKR